MNYAGRLQRMYRSIVAPRGDAVPGWAWARRILGELGSTLQLSDAAQVFALLAELVALLRADLISQLSDQVSRQDARHATAAVRQLAAMRDPPLPILVTAAASTDVETFTLP